MREMICIEYPKTKAGKRQWGKEYGLNAIYAGKHWSRRKADSEYWHSLTHAALVRAGIPRNPAPGRSAEMPGKRGSPRAVLPDFCGDCGGNGGRQK